MTIGSLALRFLIGGSAVALGTFTGRRMGGRIGGIFAAFPAVYGSAVVAAAIGLPELKAVVLSKIMPWQSIAGVFAAFPGVMSSTVGLTGWRQDSQTAAEVANGSVIGMLGGLVCILATLATLSFIAIWWVGLAVGIIAWFTAPFILHELFYGKRKKYKVN